MLSLTFQTVPHIIIETGAARRLGFLLRQRFGATRVCLVTDGFLRGSGLLDPALASLAEADFAVRALDGVVADPPEAVVLALAEQARGFAAELVIGFGGGSSMDVAKLVAVLLAGEQPLPAMYGLDKVTGGRLPLAQVPTTAGTGSEVTPIAIVTTGETTKSGIVAGALYADMAILDAELTLGLPPAVTAATGVDAMVHAIEAFTSRQRKNPLSDRLALHALELLGGNLVAACADGSNLAAREAMLLGSMLAGQAFANAPVAAVHALAYPLGGRFHVPHGLSNALVLRHVLAFNIAAVPDAYLGLADAMGPVKQGSVADKVAAWLVGLDHLVERTGMVRRLRDVGVALADLPTLAADAMSQTRLLVNNPREVTEADALRIYRSAF